jgi:putative hydroxymethylpyrimidine transport system permease protein
MNARKWRTFYYIRLPAALPDLASGIRIAAVAAPIGAIVGEWVGSSRGLGYLMLNANARMQIDMMFAALIVIIALSLILYFCIDTMLRSLITWRLT